MIDISIQDQKLAQKNMQNFKVSILIWIYFGKDR